jgi:hypothetical protein
MPLAPPIKRPASAHRHSIFTSCWRPGISNASDATAGRDYGGGEWKSCPPSLSRAHRSGGSRRSRWWGSWAEKMGLKQREEDWKSESLALFFLTGHL